MTLDIAGKNIDITPAIRERITFKYKKLEKYQLPLLNKHITISKEPNKKHKVDVSTNIPGGQLVASAENDDLWKALKEVFQKLERQLNKQAHKPEARRATHMATPMIEDELDAVAEA